MKKVMFSIGLSLFFLIVLVMPKNALASEGTVELRNTIGDNARCWASSVLMPDQTFKLLVSCRDVIYPGGTDIFNYTVWSNPISGGNPERLGELGVGKVELKTKNAFTGLFVTREKESRPRSPEGTVVMRGNVRDITFLSSATNAQFEDNELGQPEVTPTPAPRSGLSGLQLGGIIGFVGLFAIILVVFFITRR